MNAAIEMVRILGNFYYYSTPYMRESKIPEQPKSTGYGMKGQNFPRNRTSVEENVTQQHPS
jgi:hypothetical protein